jgi:hypothetical protein
MNLEQVSHYIAHPQELGLPEAPALKELSEKHPYAAVFSLLYLTALANGKSVDLDAALQQHAYRLSDRTKLYHLVHQTSEATETIPVTPAPKEEEKEDDDVQSVTQEVPEVTEQDEAAEPTHFELITEAFTREQHFDISGDLPVPTEIVEEMTVPEHLTDHEEETAQSSLQRDEHPSESETDITHTEEIIPEKAAPEPETESHKAPQPRPFTSWLKSSSETTGDVPVSAMEPAVVPEKKKVDAIIETFIKEEPTITRRKTEFFSPSAKAKESLDEDAVPVSETLAKIYAAQGNYPKAIHVYHQLMLSFPEKKSLFAVQIEALKKKITS